MHIIPLSSGVLLTVHVHQDADVGVSHSVVNLTGHGFGEEGVICCGDKHTFSGPLQQHATFCPPDRETHQHLTNHCYANLSAEHLKSTMGFYHFWVLTQMLNYYSSRQWVFFFIIN